MTCMERIQTCSHPSPSAIACIWIMDTEGFRHLVQPTLKIGWRFELVWKWKSGTVARTTVFRYSIYVTWEKKPLAWGHLFPRYHVQLGDYSVWAVPPRSLWSVRFRFEVSYPAIEFLCQILQYGWPTSWWSTSVVRSILSIVHRLPSSHIHAQSSCSQAPDETGINLLQRFWFEAAHDSDKIQVESFAPRRRLVVE